MKNPKCGTEYTRPRLAGAACASLALWICAANAGAQESRTEEIEEIVVTATPLDRNVRGLAQPASVLSGDELTSRQATSLGETLSQEPGVSSSYFGPVASRPVIRGQFGERVRVLSNSLDSMDASALSEDHAVALDSVLAEQVEIVRGPATLLYGSGAAGGLVNIVDDRIAARPLDAPFGGAVSLGTDSATGKRAAAGKVAFGNDAFTSHLDYYRLDTDDVRIPGFAESAILRGLEEEEHEHEGEEEHEHEHEHEEAFGSVHNTDSRTEGGAAAVTFRGDSGFLGLSYALHDSNYGIPEASHVHEEHEHEGEEEHEEHEHGPVRIDLDQKRFDLKGEYSLSGPFSKIRLRAAQNDYKHTELEGSEIGTVFDTRGTDGRLELHHGGSDRLDGAVGVQYKRIDFAAVGEEAFVPPSDTRQVSLFAFEEWAAGDALVLQGSARIEQQTIAAPAQAKYDESAFGASLGAIWAFTEDLSVAANLVRSERHPNATELFADGAHLAVARVERGSVTLGNGFLDKEVSTNLDVTLRREQENLSFAVTGFLNRVDDYILLSATGEEEHELPVFEYAQRDVDILGAEVEARIELIDSAAGHLHLRVFGDIVRAEERDSGDYLPRIPPLRYGLGLHFAREGFVAMVEATQHERQDRTAPNELRTDDYLMVNAEISYLIENPRVFLFARGTNLGDEDARQHTSPLKDVVPLPGRSLQLGVRYDF